MKSVGAAAKPHRAVARRAKNVLTFDEACTYTGISRTYMYKLTCGSRIPHYKPNGKNIYFDRAELER